MTNRGFADKTAKELLDQQAAILGKKQEYDETSKLPKPEIPVITRKMAPVIRVTPVQEVETVEKPSVKVKQPRRKTFTAIVLRVYNAPKSWEPHRRKRDAEKMVKLEIERGKKLGLTFCGELPWKFGVRRPVFVNPKRARKDSDGVPRRTFALNASTLARVITEYEPYKAPKEEDPDYA